MSIIDIIIVIFIALGFILGFKRGFTKEVVKALGFIAVIIVSYFLKNPLSVFLYERLPFIKFGMLRNAEILNILFYELIAFIICIVVLSILLKALLLATTVFEKILDATVILGIPSKIAGAIVGALYHFIFVFVALYVVSIIMLDNKLITNSKFREPILNNTPLLSGFVDKSMKVVDEFILIKNNYSNTTMSEDTYTYEAIDLFLKYEVIKPEALEKLIENGKINSFTNCVELINKYKENNNGN